MAGIYPPLIEKPRHAEVTANSPLVQPNTNMEQEVLVWLRVAWANDPVQGVFSALCRGACSASVSVGSAKARTSSGARPGACGQTRKTKILENADTNRTLAAFGRHEPLLSRNTRWEGRQILLKKEFAKIKLQICSGNRSDRKSPIRNPLIRLSWT